MVRLVSALCSAFCIVYAIPMADAGARRDDRYGESVSEENAYRNDAPNADGYKHAFKEPSVPAPHFMLDIAKEHITYNRSLVSSRKDTASRHAKEARIFLETSQSSYTTATLGNWTRLKTRRLRSFEGDMPENAPGSLSANTTRMKGKEAIFRGAYNRTTENWMFGYKGHAAVITGPRPRDRLRRRESFRYESPDPNDLPSDEKPSKQYLRRAHRTALCLLVACFVLMVITVLLVIAALWLRGRYRSQGTALYSTLEPNKSAPPQRSFSVRGSDVDQEFAADSRLCVDGAATPNPFLKLENRDHATAKEHCEVAASVVDHARKDILSKPAASGTHDATTTKGNAWRAKGEQSTGELRGAYLNTSFTERTSRIPQSYPRISNSDDFQIELVTSSNPLPTIIRRPPTKSTRRLCTAGSGTTTTSTAHSSSCEPRGQWKKSALAVAPLPQSSSSDSFESLAITKHNERPAAEADCCNQVMSTTPLFPLLALCKRSKPVDFLQVLHEDCQATKLCWDEPGSGDVFHVQRSQGDGIVRVLRLRESDIPWRASRLRVSRELSNLKDSVDNRTSAFFVGAKTSFVRDKYPKLLSNARMQSDDDLLLRSAASCEEQELVADHLVTEMQSGWSPLPNYALTDPEQALSVLGQACWALAVAEAELEFEHRLPVAGAVLVRPTCSPRVEFTLRGHIVRIHSAGLKVRLQGLQLARIRIGTRVELTDFERFHEFVKAEDEAHVCVRIADLLSKRPTKFEPLTNVLWLQHLADWLASQYSDAAPVLSHWQGVLAASCSAEHATVGSRRSRSPSGTASP
ncbi:hypothetical protein MRX96_042296 [Rhipicephalus microplus]